MSDLSKLLHEVCGTLSSMKLLAYAFFALILLGAAAQAQDLKGPCTVGQRVTDRSNKTGVVFWADATMCQVEFPNGTKDTYIFWMLRAAGAPQVDPRAAAGVKVGRYECYGGSTYTMDINIRSATDYADGYGNAGKFRYDAASQEITWVSGPLQGNYGKVYGQNKIGLAPKRTTFFATSCDLVR